MEKLFIFNFLKRSSKISKIILIKIIKNLKVLGYFRIFRPILTNYKLFFDKIDELIIMVFNS